MDNGMLSHGRFYGKDDQAEYEQQVKQDRGRPIDVRSHEESNLLLIKVFRDESEPGHIYQEEDREGNEV